MQIAITGATGLVGKALASRLRDAGNGVVPVSRRTQPGGVRWDPERGELDGFALEGLDAVVNLAGENLAAGRWSARRKRQLRDSRIRSTSFLGETLAHLAHPPRVLVSASALGYYGARHGDEWLDEAGTPGTDFLARLCVDWEAAAAPARNAGIRVVHPRFGLILSLNGGALAKMLPPFRLGLGGRIGSGEQWMSWIAIDDVVAALAHVIEREMLSGPVNFATGEPVRSAGFAQAVGQALHRPAIVPAPAALLRLLFGEMADLTLLASQRAASQKLAASGFEFSYPSLGGALEHLLAEGREVRG